MILFVCFDRSTFEDVFILEVEGFRRVKSFEFLGDETKCPIDRQDFRKAAKSLVDIFELDEGRFWIRAADMSVI